MYFGVTEIRPVGYDTNAFPPDIVSTFYKYKVVQNENNDMIKIIFNYNRVVGANGSQPFDVKIDSSFFQISDDPTCTFDTNPQEIENQHAPRLGIIRWDDPRKVGIQKASNAPIKRLFTNVDASGTIFKGESIAQVNLNNTEMPIIFRKIAKLNGVLNDVWYSTATGGVCNHVPLTGTF